MRFQKVEFTNYKIYYGTQELNLEVPKDQKPPYRKNLILVGGLNGSGKTTILNAINVALFARRGMTKEKYTYFLNGAINERAFSEGVRECKIALTMENEKEIITIEVKLNFNDHKLMTKEERKIYVYDQITQTRRETTQTDEEFNEFINQIIPLDVAPFFIFDGEKIQDLVEKQGSNDLKESIQRIFSLEAYKNLIKDLNKIQSDSIKELKKTAKDEEIKNLSSEVEQIIAQIDQLSLLNKKNNEEFDNLQNKLQLMDRLRRQKLAQNQNSKIQINKRITEIETKLTQLNKEMKFFGERQLHALLLGPIIKKLQEQVLQEKDLERKKIQLESRFASFDSFMEEFFGNLRTNLNFLVYRTQMEQIKSAAKEAWATVNKIEVNEDILNFTPLHDLSQGDYRKIRDYRVTEHNNIQQLVNERLKLITEKEKLDRDLESAPEAIDLSTEDNAIAELNQKIGALKTEKRQNNLNIDQLNHQLQGKRRKLGELGDKGEKKDLLTKRRDYVDRLQSAAEEFVDEITQVKATRIRNEFKNILDRLIRKEQDFYDVEFDEEQYVFKIYDEQGNEIKLQDRSAGEKQIIALSFIWALTKTSGIPLPFVIDTPLGRLDSIHRNHLIKYFFNQLSDQVMILSTDTEVNKEYQEAVKNYLVREYHLDYDPIEKHTNIKEGYFVF